LEVVSVWADEREARLEGCVEAGGADEDVDGVFGTVVAETAFLCDGVDFTVYNSDVFFAQTFEIPNSGG